MINYQEIEALAKKDGIQKFVVGGLVINNKKALLLQRPVDDFMGGIYELPSGNLEEGETLEEGLIREVNEETGLKLKNVISYLGYFDYLSGSGKKARQFNFLIDVEELDDIVLTEHDSYVWVTAEELKKYNVTDSVKEIIYKGINPNYDKPLK